MKQYALIPAYRPEETLIPLTRELEHQGFETILVDDGSGEEYRALFEGCTALCLLRHEENRGKGAALKTGLAWLKNHAQGPYVVVTADADGQHLPSDILKVAQEAQLHPEALALGRRTFGEGTPLRSRLGNALTRLLFRITSGAWIGDTQTGLRAFRETMVEGMLSIGGERYEYEMNVLLEQRRRGIPLREVAIETVYQPGNPTSHYRPLRDSLRIAGELLRFSAASLVSFGVDYSLFCLLSGFTGLVGVSNVTARLISAVVNFQLNRSLVFRGTGDGADQARRYALLAAAILVCNTLILKALTLGGLAAPAAKLVTELGLFVCSYAVQHRFVFCPEEPQRLKGTREEKAL